MATATAILDRCSKIAGLKITGAERTFALDSLNSFYKRVCRESGAGDATTTYTFVSSANDYAWTTILNAVTYSRINGVWISETSGSIQPITRISRSELLEMRLAAAGGGLPKYMAPLGTARVAFYPNPSVGTVIGVDYTAKPADLTDNSSDAPSLVDDEFHMSLLAWGTIAEMVSKDLKLKQYEAWVGRAEAKLTEYLRYVDEFLEDATPLMFGGGGSGQQRYPDERRRF